MGAGQQEQASKCVRIERKYTDQQNEGQSQWLAGPAEEEEEGEMEARTPNHVPGPSFRSVNCSLRRLIPWLLAKRA